MEYEREEDGEQPESDDESQQEDNTAARKRIPTKVNLPPRFYVTTKPLETTKSTVFVLNLPGEWSCVKRVHSYTHNGIVLVSVCKKEITVTPGLPSSDIFDSTLNALSTSKGLTLNVNNTHNTKSKGIENKSNPSE